MTIVRMAEPADEDSLVSFLKSIADDLPFEIDEDEAREQIHIVLNPNGKIPPLPTIIGVVGNVGDVEASMGLMLQKFVCSKSWYLGDLWCGVRPDKRKSSVHKDLLIWANGVSKKMGIPLVTGVFSTVRTAAKIKLYERRLGIPVGGYFFMSKAEAS